MAIFKNIHFKKRNYETANVVACVAEKAPNANYSECEESILKGLQKLWTENGATYYGWL
jgi:hypothetical protein